MPILTVIASAAKMPRLTNAIAGMLPDPTTPIPKKNPQLTAIVIDHVPPDSWLVAGKALAEHGKNSYDMDIEIADEPHTKDEKTKCIRAAHAGLARRRGNPYEESHIRVQDVRAGRYDLGGRTQEYRYHH